MSKAPLTLSRLWPRLSTTVHDQWGPWKSWQIGAYTVPISLPYEYSRHCYDTSTNNHDCCTIMEPIYNDPPRSTTMSYDPVGFFYDCTTIASRYQTIIHDFSRSLQDCSTTKAELTRWSKTQYDHGGFDTIYSRLTKTSPDLSGFLTIWVYKSVHQMHIVIPFQPFL